MRQEVIPAIVQRLREKLELNPADPQYIMTALSSPAMQFFIIDSMSGMAASQVNISQEKMKTFLLPLPPIQEQARIVAEVRRLYSFISSLKY